MSSTDSAFDPIAALRERLSTAAAPGQPAPSAVQPAPVEKAASFDPVQALRERAAQDRVRKDEAAAKIAAGRVAAVKGFDVEAAKVADGLKAETGRVVPVGVVAADKAKFSVELEQAKIIKSFTDAPLTARWFAEGENAAYARRDAEYLANLEKMLKDPSGAQMLAAPFLGVAQGAVDMAAMGVRGASTSSEIIERNARQRDMDTVLGGFTQIEAYEKETGKPATEMRAAFANRLRAMAIGGNAPTEEFRALESAAAAVEAGGSPGEALAAIRAAQLDIKPSTERGGYKTGEWLTRYITPIVSPAAGTEDMIATQFGQGIGSLAAFMATSALTGPAGSFSMATATGVDEAYQRARQSGMGHEEALRYGLLGAPAGFIQAISVEFLMRRLPAPARSRFATIVRDLAITAGAEAAVESLGAVMQNAVEQQYNPSQGLFEGTIAQGILAGSAAATLRGLMFSFAPGARRALFHDIERMETSGQIEQTFQALAEGVQASEMREQVPERFRAWAQSVTTGTKAETVYVSPEGLQQLSQSLRDPALVDRVIQNLPGVDRAAFDAAVANGTDLAIPMSTWMTDVIGTEIDSLLLPHVRLDPTQLTTFERKAKGSEIEQEINALRERANAVARGEEAEPISELEANRVRVFDDIVGKLTQAGQERSAAESIAASYAAVYSNLAAREGMSLDDFMRRFPTVDVTVEGTSVSMRPVPANPRMTFADLLSDMRSGVDNEFTRAGRAQLETLGLDIAAMTDEEVIDALELRDTLRQASEAVAPGSAALGRMLNSTALASIPFPQGPVFNGEGPSMMARPTSVDRPGETGDELFQQEIDDAATWAANLAKARENPIGFVSLGRTPMTALFSGAGRLPFVMGANKIKIVEEGRGGTVFPPQLMDNLRRLLVDPLAIIEQKGGENDSDMLIILDARTLDGQFIAVAVKKGEELRSRNFNGRVNMIRTVMPVPEAQMRAIAAGRGARAIGIRYVRDEAAVSTLALAGPVGRTAGQGLLRYEQGVAYSGERKIGTKADLVNAGLQLYQQDLNIDRLPGLEAASPGRVPGVRELATKYMISRGLPVRHQAEYVKVDTTRARIIAQLYDQAVDSPNDPEVRAAYEALAEETLAQYEALLELGFTFDWITGEDPYATPADAIRDMQDNKHLWVFPTSEGFGTNTEANRDHPLLRTTQYTIGGRVALVNDIFRIVHDVFGHGSEGASFGPRGEENAWQAHVRMFSPLAARAMTSETRGQNSWVNYGPFGAQNRANPKNTVFADQKTVLLPAWVSQVGQAADRPANVETPVTAADLGNLNADFFKRPGWIIFSATRAELGEWTTAENVGAAMEARSWLQRTDTPFVEINGRYGGVDDGPSFLIIANANMAGMIARKFGQESVLTRDGLIGATTSFAPVPSTGEVRFGSPEELGDNFSILPDGRAFALELDFNYKTTLARMKPGFTQRDDRPQLPIRRDGKVELFHWSNSQLDTVDPTKAGTGPLLGPERRRGAKLSFFGVNPRNSTREEGTGYVKEAGLGVYLHRVAVDPDRLYPWYEDPDGLKTRLSPERRNDVSAYEALIQEAGYLGYYVTEDGTGSAPLGNVAALFEATPVESMVDDTAGQVLFQSETNRWYYSALTRAAEQAKQQKASAKDWIAILSNTPGVRKDEIRWTGVDDWLETREGQVTKEELVTFLRGQELDLITNIGTENATAMDGDGEFEFTEQWNEPMELDYDYISERTEEELDDVFEDMRQELEDELRDDLDSVTDDFEANFPDGSFDDAISELIEQKVHVGQLQDRSEDELSPEAAWLADYVTVRKFAGLARSVRQKAEERVTEWAMDDLGTVYHYEARFPDGSSEEFTLNYEPSSGEYYVPELSDSYSSIGDVQDAIREKYEERFAGPDDEGADVGVRWGSYTEQGGKNYREVLLRVPNLPAVGPNDGRVGTGADDFVNANHFAQPNIVVHARLKDRTDLSNRRTLFVEEIQSDLASDIRKHYDEMAKNAVAFIGDAAVDGGVLAQLQEEFGVEGSRKHRVLRGIVEPAVITVRGGQPTARDMAAIPDLTDPEKPRAVEMMAEFLRGRPDLLETYDMLRSADQPWRSREGEFAVQQAEKEASDLRRQLTELRESPELARNDATLEIMALVENVMQDVYRGFRTEEMPVVVDEFMTQGSVMTRLRQWATKGTMRVEDGSDRTKLRDDFAEAVLARITEVNAQKVEAFKQERIAFRDAQMAMVKLEAARDRAVDKADRLRKLHDIGYLPFTPFDSVIAYEVMLKRLLNLAAKEGYGALAWTPGYMQAQRWSGAVQNVVEEVRWEAVNYTPDGRVDPTGAPGRMVELRGSNGNDMMIVDMMGVIISKTGGRIPPDQVIGRNVAELIGGQIARSILDSDNGSLSGNRIVIGGDGYKISYDQTMKKFVEKWAKKFGGRLTTTVMPDFLDTEQVSGFIRDQFAFEDGEARVMKFLSELDARLVEGGMRFPDGMSPLDKAKLTIEFEMAETQKRLDLNVAAKRQSIEETLADQMRRVERINTLLAAPEVAREVRDAEELYEASVEEMQRILGLIVDTPVDAGLAEFMLLQGTFGARVAQETTGTTLDALIGGFSDQQERAMMAAARYSDVSSRTGSELGPLLLYRRPALAEEFTNLTSSSRFPKLMALAQNRTEYAGTAQRLTRKTQEISEEALAEVRAYHRQKVISDQARNMVNIATGIPAALDWLQAQYPDALSVRPVWYIELNDKMKEAAVQPQPLFQGQRGKIVLPPKGQVPVITLFANADLSTVLHEMGHHYLYIIEDLATRPDASAEMKADWEVIRNWWRNNTAGVAADARKVGPLVEPADVERYLDTGTTGDGAKDRAISVGLQEQWARANELYLREGNSPSQALRAAFRKFKAWFISIYRRAEDLNVAISPEMRDVFDRLYATEEELATAKDDTKFGTLSAASAEEMGVDEETWRRLLELQDEAAAEQEEIMLREIMAPLRRQATEAYRRERAEVEAQVRAEVIAKPVQRLREWVGNGRWLDGDAPTDLPPDIRIDRDELVAIYGEDILRQLPRGRYPLYSRLGEGGLLPDEMASWFGFSSGDAMIQALRGSSNVEAEVKAETDARMKQRERDPMMEPGRIEQAAVDALHGEKAGMLLVAELRALAKAGNVKGKVTPRQQAREVARRTIAGTRVREALRSFVWQGAERKAANEAAEALARGDRQGAFDAKRRQLVNHMLYGESRKAADMVAQLERLTGRLKKKSTRENLAPDYLAAIDEILATYEFTRISNRQMDRRGALRRYVEMMRAAGRENELAIPSDVLERAEQINYRELTVEELEGVFDALRNIEHTARFKKKLLDAKAQRELDEVVDEVVQNFEENLKRDPRGRVRTDADRRGRGVKQYLNLVLNATTILRKIDGQQTGGAAYRAIKTRIDLAQREATRLQEELAEKLETLYGAYTRTEMRRMATKKRYDFVDADLSRWDIISVALNMGNVDNLQRLTDPDSRGFTRAQIDRLVDELDQRDWEFVQGMIDLINSYWPAIAERETRLKGVPPKKVQPLPIETKFGTYPGGYYPIMYDGELSATVTDEQTADLLKNVMPGKYGKAQTAAGHLEARKNGSGGRPLMIGIEVAHAHLGRVIHDIAFSEAVTDTWKVLQHKRLRGAFQDFGMLDDLETLELWVQDVATGSISSQDVVSRMFRRLKANFTLSKLGFNMATVAVQLTGIAQSMVVVGKRDFAVASAQYLKSVRGVSREIMAKSDFMRRRQTTFNKDIFDIVGEVTSGPVEGTYSYMMRKVIGPAAFFVMQKVQFYGVDIPTWLAAYNKAIRSGQSEADAVAEADATLVRAQAGGEWADRSAFERGTMSRTSRQSDITRLFTTLGSYMFAKLNIAYDRTVETKRTIQAEGASLRSVGAAFGYASDMALLFIVEAMLYGAITGRLPDDEDEDDAGWAAFILRETGFSIAAGLPFIRDLTGPLQGFSAGGAYGGITETMTTPIVRAMGDSEEMSLSTVKSIINAVGLATGLPSTASNRVIDGIWRSAEGEDVSPVEYLMGRR
ncbi:lysin [Microcystis phage Mel-JY33]